MTAEDQVEQAIGHSKAADEVDAKPIVDRLRRATDAGLIDWRQGEMITLYAFVGEVRFEVYFTLNVGDRVRTWRRYDIDVRPLREAISAYLERPAAAPTSKAVTALDSLLNGEES